MLKSENAIYCGLCKFAVGYFCPILGIFSDDICDDKLQFGCWVGVLYLFGKKKKPSKCKPCPTLTREGSRREAVAVCPHFGRVCSAYHKKRTNRQQPARRGRRPARQTRRQASRSGLIFWYYGGLPLSIVFKGISRRFDVSPYPNTRQPIKAREAALKRRIQ